MPTEFKCSACGLAFSTGSYHGSGAQWYNALYCRHCGTSYRLEEDGRQFLDGFGAARSERKTWEYRIHGPTTTQHVTLSADTPVAVLKCESCGAEGPFGPKGPITDESPPGLSDHPFMPPSDATSSCPRCKAQTLKAVGNWIT